MRNTYAARVSTARRNMYLAVLLSGLVACHDSASPVDDLGPEETMRVLRAAGEWNSPNELSAPEGAALRAVNVVVDDPGKYTTHKGLVNPAGTGNVSPAHPLSSFTYYQGSLFAHSQADGTLSKLTGNTWADVDGSYYTPDALPMSFQEQKGSLFFTTTAGLYRMDGPDAVPVLAGLPQALPGTATLTGASGFLDGGEAVVYRANWAVKVDTGGGTSRLIEGAPSPRLLVSNGNAAGTFRDVALEFPIPDGLPTGAFLRVFRSDIVPDTLSPLDEVRQVLERAPTTAEVTAAVFSATDTTPDTVKGAGAYFSANTGDGIAQSNYRPPLVRGLSSFAQSVFGVGVDGVQRVILNVLGTGTSGLQDGQKIILARGATEEIYTGSSAGETFPDTFEWFAGPTPAQAVASTVASFARAVNSRTGGIAHAFVLDTDGSTPGRILIEARDLDTTPISVTTDYGSGQAFAPALPSFIAPVSAISRTANVVTVTTAVAHGLAVDDDVELYYGSGPADPDFPAGVFAVSGTPTPTTFTYAQTGANATGMGSYFLRSLDGEVTTEDGTSLNAYAWSKTGEPDHWPLQNLNTVGDSTDTLLWAQELDRYNFLGSEGGLFRITGTAEEGFTDPENGSPWDSNVRFLGRRTHAALDGQVFALAQEGIVSFTESSKPQPVDAAIQQEVREAILNYPDKVEELAFFVADGLNHRLYVALPESTTATAATKVHVLNMKSGGAWSRLTSTFPGLADGAMGGAAPPDAGGTLYLLPGAQATSNGLLYATRNTGTLADYQGPNSTGIPAKVTYLPWVAGEPERQKQWTWTRLFTSDVSAIQFCYASDWVPAEECQALPSLDPERLTPVEVADPIRSLAWKTLIGATPGTSYQRARALTVSVGHSVPLEKFELLGAEVQHRAYGKGQ
jgi:hypothetical protein